MFVCIYVYYIYIYIYIRRYIDMHATTDGIVYLQGQLSYTYCPLMHFYLTCSGCGLLGFGVEPGSIEHTALVSLQPRSHLARILQPLPFTPTRTSRFEMRKAAVMIQLRHVFVSLRKPENDRPGESTNNEILASCLFAEFEPRGKKT